MRNFFPLGFVRVGAVSLIIGAAVLLMAFVPVYAEAEDIDGIVLELRNRLDSIEVEIQARKRSGSPIGDLEAITAGLRDTLSGMREQVAAAYQPGAPSETPGSGLSFDWITGIIPEGVLSFRPKELFDWIIVGTGAVALLAALVLLTGIFTGRKRKRKERAAAKKPAVRKVNLAPPTAKSKAVGTGPEIDYGGSAGSDGAAGENLHSLVEHLRKLSPQTDNSSYPMSPASSMNTAPFTPPVPSADNAPSTPPPIPPAPPTSGSVPFTPPPMPPPEPPPLILNAPEPPPPRATGEDLNGMIISAASDGLSETEIAKLHQVSVDQVRLILRMSR